MSHTRGNLIIDVGMHDGRDTAFYLAKGFDVVAVEANPALVEDAQQRFADEIRDGRMQLIGAAVAETEGTMPLAVSEQSIWSTLSQDFVDRNTAHGTAHHYVDVPTLRFETILAEVGIPYYLKVDIEGYDMLCVRALHAFDERPAYVSIESNVTANDAPQNLIAAEIDELSSLGYTRFKYVNQRRHPDVRMPNPPREGSYVDASFVIDDTGPFGAETEGKWMSERAARLTARQLGLRHHLGGLGGRWSQTVPGKAFRGARLALTRKRGAPWYDLHAAR